MTGCSPPGRSATPSTASLRIRVASKGAGWNGPSLAELVLDVLGLRRVPKGHVVLAPGVRRRLHGVVLALVEHLLELRRLPPTEIVGVEVAGAITEKVNAAMVGGACS